MHFGKMSEEEKLLKYGQLLLCTQCLDVLEVKSLDTMLDND